MIVETSAKPQVENIPGELKQLPQWASWTNANGTKLPTQIDGTVAKSNDPNTWTTFDRVEDAPRIAFILSQCDPYCGIDLDGCRNPSTGAIEQWAMTIIDELTSYTEVSPSGTGVKIIARGQNPFSTGKNLKIDVERIEGVSKEPGVEMYDHKRFWTMTGDVLAGDYRDINEAQEGIDWFASEYWAAKQAMPTTFNSNTSTLVDRARKYVEKVPSAVAGQNGHDQTYSVACVLVDGFGLSRGEQRQTDYHQQTYEPQPKNEVAYDFMALGELVAGNFPVNYLIENALVMGEHAMIHGPSKCFKTMIALDMGTSLASGSPFVGYYEVKKTCNVLYWSGENAKAETAERLKRICNSKDIDPSKCQFELSCNLPQIADVRHVDAILRKVDDFEANVIFVDPTYLALDTGGRGGDMFHIGQQLRPLAKECANRDVTFILIHHDTQSRTRNNYELPTFSNMSFAGFEQHARQWVSLARRAPHDPESGRSSIWLVTGGSMGHQSCIGMEITEGLCSDDGGRIWELEHVPFTEAKQGKVDDKQRRKEEHEDRLVRNWMKRIEPQITDEWKTMKQVAEDAGAKPDRKHFLETYHQLLIAGRIETCEMKARNGHVCRHIRRKQETEDTNGGQVSPVTVPGVPHSGKNETGDTPFI